MRTTLVRKIMWRMPLRYAAAVARGPVSHLSYSNAVALLRQESTAGTAPKRREEPGAGAARPGSGYAKGAGGPMYTPRVATEVLSTGQLVVRA